MVQAIPTPGSEWEALGLPEQPADPAHQRSASRRGGQAKPSLAARVQVGERACVDQRVAGRLHRQIVAASLAFGANPFGDPPHGRVVEQGRLDRALDDVDQVIASQDVGQFVRQEGADLACRADR